MVVYSCLSHSQLHNNRGLFFINIGLFFSAWSFKIFGCKQSYRKVVAYGLNHSVSVDSLDYSDN